MPPLILFHKGVCFFRDILNASQTLLINSVYTLSLSTENLKESISVLKNPTPIFQNVKHQVSSREFSILCMLMLFSSHNVLNCLLRSFPKLPVTLVKFSTTPPRFIKFLLLIKSFGYSQIDPAAAFQMVVI